MLETLSDQTIKSYNEKASSYEARWESYLNHTHEAFLDRIKTTKQDIILDASGGTGLLAQMLINRGYSFQQLTVNDPSRAMLEIASERLSDHPGVHFTNYRAEQLPRKPNHFDCIFSLNSFHFYSNQPQVLDQFHIILKPGGRLYLLDWNRQGFFIFINQLLKWTSSEYINTRSLPELTEILDQEKFTIHHTERWNWRYWKFLFVEAIKPG